MCVSYMYIICAKHLILNSEKNKIFGHGEKYLRNHKGDFKLFSSCLVRFQTDFNFSFRLET